MSSSNIRKTVDKDASQWIFLMNDSVLNGTSTKENYSPSLICKLQHPRTGTGSMYLIGGDEETLYEITKFSEPHRSWFIDQTVQQDGGLYMTTPVDPVYLILPYLMQTEKNGKYQVIDQIISDPDFPECGRLCGCLTTAELTHVADVKGAGDISAYRYNREKTMTWLKKKVKPVLIRPKVERVAEKLETMKLNVSGGALSHVFVRSCKTTNTSNEDYVRYAHGLVSEYLPTSLCDELRNFMGIKDPELPKREKPDIKEPAAKKAKIEDVGPSEDYSQNMVLMEDNKKNKSLSAAQNKLSKVDTKGMKSISSFFLPKSKK